MRSLALLPSALAAALLFACSGAPEGVVANCETSLSLPPGVATDVLFVIDDSRSMQEEQEKVVDELETFVAALLEGPVENDFQVGVVTTSVTEHVVGCREGAEPMLRTYDEAMGQLQRGRDEEGLEADGPTILRWDDPDFLPRFRQLITQGIDGSGQEMGLEAMRMALSEPLISTANKGFLRPGSRLLVVVVSDEDDCSDPLGTSVVLQPVCERIPCDDDEMCGPGSYCVVADDAGNRSCVRSACETEEGRARLEPVERYVEFLRNLDDGTGQGRKRETFFAAIGPVELEPPHEPVRCTSEEDEAYGVGVRYREMVDLLGDAAYVDSICSESYGDALQQIAELASAPHVITLSDSPEDGRLIVVEIERGEESIRCTQGDGFSYEPPRDGAKGRVTLDGRCRLRHGDGLDVRLFCAG